MIDVEKLFSLESAEIVDKCPSMNPEVPFDASASKETSIPVPGGDKEQPTASDHKEQSIAVPGGDKEQPTASEHKEVSVPAAKKVMLSDDAYNVALKDLQKSFNEACDILNILCNCERYHESAEDVEKKFMEQAQDQAYVDFCESVLYEKVDKSDKSDIKDIVKNLRDEVEKFCDEKDYEFYVPKVWIRAFVGAFLWPVELNAAVKQLWTTREFQVLGNVVIEDGKVDDLVAALNKKFSEELGDYKIIKYAMTPNTIDWFRTKFNWKNQLGIFMLLVDKKLPEEFKEIHDKCEEAEKKAEEEKKDDEKKEEEKKD